jgi:hypothetical protein
MTRPVALLSLMPMRCAIRFHGHSSRIPIPGPRQPDLAGGVAQLLGGIEQPIADHQAGPAAGVDRRLPGLDRLPPEHLVPAAPFDTGLQLLEIDAAGLEQRRQAGADEPVPAKVPTIDRRCNDLVVLPIFRRRRTRGPRRQWR